MWSPFESQIKRLLAYASTSTLVNLWDASHEIAPAAKTAAAKAALLTRLIAKEDANPSLAHWRTMPELEDLRSLEISGEWERLNRLKATNPEAFWYWYQASTLG